MSTYIVTYTFNGNNYWQYFKAKNKRTLARHRRWRKSNGCIIVEIDKVRHLSK